MPRKLKFETREQYLKGMYALLEKHVFTPNDIKMPKKVRMATGFPSKQAFSTVKRRIGECWDPIVSADGSIEIFISPVLDKPIDVADVLVHEMVHAAAGVEFGHKGPFKKMAIKIGLEGKMTETNAGDDLKKILNKIIQELGGKYPHSAMNYSKIKKPAKKFLKKFGCTECGWIGRVTQKWIDYGLPTCTCGGEMKVMMNEN